MHKVLVVGDSCQDVFEYGRCERICPDAPVPVFIPQQINSNGGMAANVAANLEALGLSVRLMTNDNRITKTRYIDQKTNHMFLRVDSHDDKIERIQKENVVFDSKFLDKFDAVIISDYDKGYLEDEDISKICKLHPRVFIDSKKHIGDWQNDAFLIKINNIEFRASEHTIGKEANLIVTLGSEGAVWKTTGEIFPVSKVEVKDMTGAGDTFMAGLVCKFLQTSSIEDAIRFGNLCATEVVQKRGVSVVSAK